MKKAFDQNVSRAKPRLKLGNPDLLESETATPAPETDEAWVYEVAAQVAGQPRAAETPSAPTATARELIAAATRPSTPAAEPTPRARVEATLRGASEPVAP